MRAIILTRNKHAEEHIKSIRSPLSLSLQLDPAKSSKERELQLKKRPFKIDPLED